MEKQIRSQADFAYRLKFEDLSGPVISKVRHIILDSIGCIICGSKGEVFSGNRDDAILDCAMAMTETELYEGNRFAVGHPACHILPLMLLCARGGHISSRAFIRIFAAAYEIAARWGSGVVLPQASLGHGTVMTAGAAAAAALLNALDQEAVYQSILLANALPNVSVWQSVFDGSALHDAYPGLSAITALRSVRMLQRGVRGSASILNDVWGRMLGAPIIIEKLDKDLGQDFLIMKNYYKFHTGCRFVHPFADLLAEEIRGGLRAHQVESVTVRTYQKAARLKARQVPNALAAKFSIPVSLAVLLCKGRLSPQAIEHCENDPEIQSLSGKITVLEDEAYNRLLPNVRGGKIILRKTGGAELSLEALHAKGDFDHPHSVSEADLIEKFRDITAPYWSAEDQTAQIEKILESGHNATETMDDVLSIFYRRQFTSRADFPLMKGVDKNYW
jgi:2-methylcitrate dehydratase PrpD